MHCVLEYMGLKSYIKLFAVMVKIYAGKNYNRRETPTRRNTMKAVTVASNGFDRQFTIGHPRFRGGQWRSGTATYSDSTKVRLQFDGELILEECNNDGNWAEFERFSFDHTYPVGWSKMGEAAELAPIWESIVDACVIARREEAENAAIAAASTGPARGLARYILSSYADGMNPLPTLRRQKGGVWEFVRAGVEYTPSPSQGSVKLPNGDMVFYTPL